MPGEVLVLMPGEVLVWMPGEVLMLVRLQRLLRVAAEARRRQGAAWRWIACGEACVAEERRLPRGTRRLHLRIRARQCSRCERCGWAAFRRP